MRVPLGKHLIKKSFELKTRFNLPTNSKEGLSPRLASSNPFERFQTVFQFIGLGGFKPPLFQASGSFVNFRRKFRRWFRKTAGPVLGRETGQLRREKWDEFFVIETSRGEEKLRTLVATVDVADVREE